MCHQKLTNSTVARAHFLTPLSQNREYGRRRSHGVVLFRFCRPGLAFLPYPINDRTLNTKLIFASYLSIQN